MEEDQFLIRKQSTNTERKIVFTLTGKSRAAKQQVACIPVRLLEKHHQRAS